MTNQLGLPAAETLADEILEARKEALQQRRRAQISKDYLYMSDVSVCTRANYYAMTDNEKREPMSDDGLARTEAGEIWEKEIIRQLLDYRFQVQGQGEKVEITYKNKLLARGKLDVVLVFQGKRIPVEIKNLDSNVFKRITCVEDLFKVEWTEKYLRQLLLYMYGNSIESGLFIITDRGGFWKVLVVHLGNYLDYAEKTLKSMERAYDAKEQNEPPDRIEFQPRICNRCAFRAVCLPDKEITGDDAINDPELEALLERHEALKPAAREFDGLHEDVKEIFKNRSDCYVGGRFHVKVKKRVKVSYDTKALTDEQRAAIKKETEFSVVDVEQIKEKA